MKLALVVVGDGRRSYLDQAVKAVKDNCLHPIHSRIMVCDEADYDYRADLRRDYPEWIHIQHATRRGMAGAIQAGFDAALDCDPDYTLWIEEDMLVTKPLPIGAAMSCLDSNRDLAQMLFQRQPITPEEHLTGSVTGAFRMLTQNYGEHGPYSWHDHIFSLNPCLIPRRILEMGWDTDNERGMSQRLREAGYTFGCWLDGPMVEHIGVERSPEWRL